MLSRRAVLRLSAGYRRHRPMLSTWVVLRLSFLLDVGDLGLRGFLHGRLSLYVGCRQLTLYFLHGHGLLLSLSVGHFCVYQLDIGDLGRLCFLHGQFCVYPYQLDIGDLGL